MEGGRAQAAWTGGGAVRADVVMRLSSILILLALGLSGVAGPGAAWAEIAGPALVQADGSLKVAGRHIRLHGIHIPASGRTCRTRVRPARCGSRSVLALEAKIGSIVRCDPVGRFRDGSLSAVCRIRGDGSVLAPDLDLSVWMLSQGWALARPNAPFAYHAQERIARSRSLGSGACRPTVSADGPDRAFPTKAADWAAWAAASDLGATR